MSAIPARQARAASRVETKMVLVTPTMASEWLANANKNNRPINPRHVDKLADDMAAGRFLVTHQGIGFNCDGSLLDGQHRLAAIVQSRVSQHMLVTTGLSKETPAAIDDHLKRSVASTLTMVYGVELPQMNRAVAAAWWVREGVGPFVRHSRSDMVENVIKHQDALRWAVEHYSTAAAGKGRAPVLGMIARAYYTAPRTKLAHFAEVVMDQGASLGGADNWAVRLQTELIETMHDAGGWWKSSQVYKQTQYALRKFLDGHTPRSSRKMDCRLVAADEDLFPMPK